MKKVYYKGEAFRGKTMRDEAGKTHVLLYKNGLLTHFVEESELDKRTVVGTILNAYYRSIMEEQPSIFSMWN